MPELPEVETTKNGLLPHIKGKIVDKVNIYFPTFRYEIPPIIITKITGKQLLDITRRGKYLIFIFEVGHLLIHLGMSGKMEITSDVELKKHDHFELVFGNTFVRLNDPRRFGCVLWCEDFTTHKLIKNLGVEPLEAQFTGKYLFETSRTKHQHIKAFITNNNVVVGVGNIYACESLFATGIHPEKPANTLSLQQYEQLARIIMQTLKVAIHNGGTTLQDFAGVSGELGYFAQKLQVYGRASKHCTRCQGKIERIVQNQRSTFYCKNCQT